MQIEWKALLSFLKIKARTLKSEFLRFGMETFNWSQKNLRNLSHYVPRSLPQLPVEEASSFSSEETSLPSSSPCNNLTLRWYIYSSQDPPSSLLFAPRPGTGHTSACLWEIRPSLIPDHMSYTQEELQDLIIYCGRNLKDISRNRS